MKKYLENDEDVEILETWKDLKEYLTFRAKHDEWVQPFINELAAIGIPNHPLFFQTNCTNLSVVKTGSSGFYFQPWSGQPRIFDGRISDE